MDASYYGTGAEAAEVAGVIAILGVFFMIFMLIIAAMTVISIIAFWKIFTKAGKPGWASLIPFYNNYVMFEIIGMSGWMFLLLCIPIVNIVMLILLLVKLAQVFGKSTGFAIGLIFLSPIFLLILAFDKSTYCLNSNNTVSE